MAAYGEQHSAAARTGEMGALYDAPSKPDIDLPTNGSSAAEGQQGGSSDRAQLKGWRLRLFTLVLCTSLFLSSIEVTIVSTSLIDISRSLGRINEVTWISNSYLITYTGFLVIIAKLSDTFGRRLLLLASLIIFTIFSAACGAAQTMTQLIVFRAFQGIGGAGMFTMVFVVLPEMCAPSEHPLYVAVMSATTALASLLGPLMGGAISLHTTWRWIFLLNVPATVAASGALVVSIPSSWPLEPEASSPRLRFQSLRRIDFLGLALSLAATALLVTALQQGREKSSWIDPTVLPTLIISLILWAATISWSKFLSIKATQREAMLPWRILTSRFSLGILVSSFWTGAVFFTLPVVLPQRFQILYNDTPQKAGFRLLSLSLLSPVGGALIGFIARNLHQPTLYILIASTAAQIVGTGLLGSIGAAPQSWPAAGYGFQAIVGLSVGATIGATILAARLVFDMDDMGMPVGMGLIAQFRALGGSIGLAACIKTFNDVTGGISTHPEGAELSFEETKLYGEGFRRQMICVSCFAAAALVSTSLMEEESHADNFRGCSGCELFAEPLM